MTLFQTICNAVAVLIAIPFMIVFGIACFITDLAKGKKL